MQRTIWSCSGSSPEERNTVVMSMGRVGSRREGITTSKESLPQMAQGTDSSWAAAAAAGAAAVVVSGASG